MNIRKAKKEDTKSIAYLLLLAMDDIICQFIGQNDTTKALEFLETMIAMQNNQYSYHNCWVVEDNQTITAAINIYDGAALEQLRQPIKDYIKAKYRFSKDFEDETQAGEYYIDSLGVHPQHQGKGLGSTLLQFIINELVINQRLILGLLVDKENPAAKKLYLKLGFKIVGEKKLAGKTLEHLQISSN